MLALQSSIEGQPRITELFERLGSGVGNKAFRKSLRAGTKVIAAADKALIPQDSGTAKKSIKIRSLKRKVGRIGLRVTGDPEPFNAKAKRLGRTSHLQRGVGSTNYYLAVLEYGSSTKAKRRVRRHDVQWWVQGLPTHATRRVPARHYLRVGFDASQQLAIDTVGSTLAESLEATMKATLAGSAPGANDDEDDE